jgi:hypothetical protein
MITYEENLQNAVKTPALQIKKVVRLIKNKKIHTIAV